MGMNIKPRQDYSSLFSSLGNGSSTTNILADYASIKNGSYGKLMKAYYAKDVKTPEVTSTVKKQTQKFEKTDAKEEVKALTDIEKAAEGLKTSVDDLMSGEYESEEDAFNAVSSMVKGYNALVEKAGASTNEGIVRKTDNLAQMTSFYKNDLSKIGITINKDNKLSIDKDTFLNSDMSIVEDLFSPTKSFARSLSENALLIDSQANYEATRADLYTNTGSFTKDLNIGSMMDSLF